MRILITAATAAELLPARQVWESFRNQANNSLSMECVETGIGTTSTTYHTLKALLVPATKAFPFKHPTTHNQTLLTEPKISFDMAINIGIAGSYCNAFPIGTVVRVVSDCFGDTGVQTASGFHTLFDAQLMDANTFPFVSGKLSPPPLAPEWESALSPIPFAKGVTVQHLVETTDPDNYLCTSIPFSERFCKETFEVETMEGAAFFYVCMMERIPCLSLRSLSNRAGERDKAKWNIPLALDNLLHTLKKIVHTI